MKNLFFFSLIFFFKDFVRCKCLRKSRIFVYCENTYFEGNFFRKIVTSLSPSYKRVSLKAVIVSLLHCSVCQLTLLYKWDHKEQQREKYVLPLNFIYNKMNYNINTNKVFPCINLWLKLK